MTIDLGRKENRSGRVMDKEKEFDEKTLAANNGQDGNPVYISHGGRVVDVSKSPLWAGGIHMGRHHAGTDLTLDIEAAPHGTEVLDRYPQIGRLTKEKPSAENLPHLLSLVLRRFPLLRRHPHPVMAHFPIVFTLSATFFSVLYLLTRDRSFDQTAFYCLIGALLFAPLAILTGLVTWWINYLARPLRPVTIKKWLSFPLPVVLAGLIGWRYFVPGVLDDLSGWGMVYLLFVLAVSPAVLIIGYYGGTLTFPVEKG